MPVKLHGLMANTMSRTTTTRDLELIQARMPKAMKSAMDSTLRAILDGKSRDEVDEDLSAIDKQRYWPENLGEDLLMVGKLKEAIE